MSLGDRRVAAGQRHEALGEVIYRSLPAEQGEFADRAARERQPEPLDDQLDELGPRRQSDA
jgi:hypothetical protein